ncbi:facilitated trehalose transporter Tret1-like [Achroia grisella]|uniref:facilitated trehalose transporter Tret1-like n=1 Tax=Achroia grisella TaxID=688607 RepID=UPI0027D1FF5F|nr:facilitated trehalose transporter Tret1-like [Achroia grisella]
MLCLKLGPIWWQYMIVTGATLSVLSTGLSLGWGSPVLVKLMKMGNGTEMLLSNPITTEDGSWLVSIGPLVSIFSALLTPISNVIGHKYTIVLSSLPNIIAGLIFVFADKFWLVLLGRGFCGVSMGMIIPIISVYSAEIANNEIRGSLCSILQVICGLGCVTMFIVGPFMTYLNLNILYSCLTILCSIPALFVPQSPYFLYTKGRIQEAHQLLTFLRGSEELAQAEIEQYSLCNNVKQIETPKKVYREKLFLKAVYLCICVSILTQCSGYNSVSYYLQTLLESTETNISPAIASAVVGVLQLLGGCITACIIDKYGRKTILSISFLGIALGSFGLGTFFKLKETQEMHGILNYVPIVSIIFVVYSFIAGPGTLLFTLQAELFDRPTKTVGASISIFTNMLIMFLAIRYNDTIINYIGVYWNYWMFSCISVFGCLFVILFIPETKGKTFTEIQELLGNGCKTTFTLCK